MKILALLVLSTWLAPFSFGYEIEDKYLACKNDADCGEIDTSSNGCTNQRPYSIRYKKKLKQLLEQDCKDQWKKNPHQPICDASPGLLEWLIPTANAKPAPPIPYDHKCVDKLCALVRK